MIRGFGLTERYYIYHCCHIKLVLTSCHIMLVDISKTVFGRKIMALLSI